MAVSVESVIASVMPVLKVVAVAAPVALIVGIVGYYFLVINKRRKWIVNIWEVKSNNKIYLVGRDTLISRKFNQGKQTMYLFKKAKVESVPPPDECIDRINGKEIANYLRILEDYIPLKREVSFDDNNKEKLKEDINKLKNMTTIEGENHYIYAPLEQVITGKICFTPIDYDVNMMRINALENRSKIYADLQDFMAKYGSLIAIGVIAVLIIIVLYFSYDYSLSVIDRAMGAAAQVSKPLNAIAERLGVVVPS